MKYIWAILVSIIVVVVFTIIFNYFNYDGRFLTGWFGAMGYYITLDLHRYKKEE